MKKVLVFLAIAIVLLVGCDPNPAPDPEPTLYKLIIDFRVTGGIGMEIQYRVGAGEEVSLYVADTHYSYSEYIEDGTVIYARNRPDPITGNAGITLSADGKTFAGGNCPGEALCDATFNADYVFGG